MGRNIAYSFRRVFTQPLVYPLLVYLVGLGIVLKYILTTNYLGGATTCTEFALYMFYASGGEWQPFFSPFGLQSSCLSVAWLPAMLQNLTGIEPVLFYKSYHALILPFFPVVVYFLLKRFLGANYALLGVLFVIGTVTFLQSPSMARTTIALIFYGLLLVVFKSDMRYRFPLVVGLSVLLVLSHYTTTYLAIFIFAGASVFGLIRWLRTRKEASQLILMLVALITLAAGSLVWYGVVNDYALYKAEVRMATISDTASQGIADVGTRDKIVQAAFGAQHPDGDKIFQFNWWLFGVSWVVVGLITWGMVRSVLKRDLPLEFLAMSAMCFILLAVTVLIPGVSRGYGIERVFYQCTPLFGILLVKGVGNPRQYSWAILLPLLLAYGWLNMNYGVIHSITGT